MYGVQGRTWVALGDPVGPAERLQRADSRAFSSAATTSAACRSSTRSARTHLHRYADFGLTFVKLGEEARVDLTTFTLEGGQAREYRQVIRRLEKDGATFRVVDAGGACRRSSTSFARCPTTGSPQKAGAEKGFSLGFFDDAVPGAVPGRRHRARRPHRGVRQHLAGPQQRSCRST